MTPRTVDWRAITAKLRRMHELLEQLRALGPVDLGRLRSEPVTSLALERILTLLVELAFGTNSHLVVALLGRAPDTYAESFSMAVEAGIIDAELAGVLRPSVGLRNVLVHDYLDVDQAVVVRAAVLAADQYGGYVRQVAAFLRAHAD